MIQKKRLSGICLGCALLLVVISGCGEGDGESSSTGASSWTRVGSQVSAADAESEDPVMLLSTPRVGYRHASYEIALNAWNGIQWGTSTSDPSSGNYESFYGPPNFCEQGSTVYTVFAHSGVASSSGSDFYDHVLASSWDATNGWLPMNGGNEISNAWPGNQWDAYGPTIACQAVSVSEDTGVKDPNDDSGDGALQFVKQIDDSNDATTTYDAVIAWVEADNATITDHVYVGLVGRQSSLISGPVSRNEADGSFLTDVRVVGLTADASHAYVAQWENDAMDQYKIELYVTELSLPDFAQTPLGGSLDVDYNGNTLCAPSLAVYGGDLIVAYSAFRPRAGTTANTRDIYVQRWDGSSWTSMGSGPVTLYSNAAHQESNHPSLLVAGNALYLAWEEDGGEGSAISIAAWDEANASWVVSDANRRVTTDIATQTLDPSLAYDAEENALYVAFEAMVSGWPQIYVKKRGL